MCTSPSTMIVAVSHFSGTCRVQRRPISLPRVDALLNDPEARYCVTTEEPKPKVNAPVNLSTGAHHRGPRAETVEREAREKMSEAERREAALQRLAALWHMPDQALPDLCDRSSQHDRKGRTRENASAVRT